MGDGSLILLCLFFYKPVSLFGKVMTTTRFKRRTRLIRFVDLDDDVNMRFSLILF